MAKLNIIENEADRIFVRSIYPNAHCREVPNQSVQTYGITFSVDRKGKSKFIAPSTVSRSEAWRKAAAFIRTEIETAVVKKLESL